MANNASPRRTRFQENTGGGPKCRSLSYHPADTETSMAIPGKHSGWSSYRNPELFTRIALSPRGQKFTYMVIFRGYTFVHSLRKGYRHAYENRAFGRTGYGAHSCQHPGFNRTRRATQRQEDAGEFEQRGAPSAAVASLLLGLRQSDV